MSDLAERHLGLKTIQLRRRRRERRETGDVQCRTGRTRDRIRRGRRRLSRCDCTKSCGRNSSPSRDCESVFEDIEMPLVGVLSRMERTGALVDGKLLTLQSDELARRIAELAQEAFSIAGEAFNLDSTKQLQAILYDKLGLPVLRKTPGGQPSTAEPVLAELALDYPLPRVIMDYRSLTKLKSTYTDKLPLQINPRTGRIHTSYHQAVAATGRLSSVDPNLQNIPVRTAEGRRIRQAFIAPEGRTLVAADYSQIELRIMAHLSADVGLRRAFSEGLDVHRATAAEVFGCAARFGHRRSAAQRQGDQLRLDVRHVGVRLGSSARRQSHGRAASTSNATSPAIRACGTTWMRVRARGGETGLRRNRVRPTPVSAGDQREQRDAPTGGRAHGDQRADARNGGRHHQTRDDCGGSLACGRGNRRVDDHAGSRRADLRSRRCGCRRADRRHRAAHGGSRDRSMCRWSSTSAAAATGTRRTEARSGPTCGVNQAPSLSIASSRPSPVCAENSCNENSGDARRCFAAAQCRRRAPCLSLSALFRSTCIGSCRVLRPS